MFWSKYRVLFLLLVYFIFFGHTALWHQFGFEKIGHLGFGCIFGSMRNGLITAGTVFTLLIFAHALFFGGLFCGWMCHWGILQDFAAWTMKKVGIKPPMAHVNSRMIPWFWFLILIGQVVLFWIYSGFPTSLSFKMDANPVWHMVPRSILMIILTTIISGFALIFLFGERAFCRTICIFRIWFSWFERFAPHKIRQQKKCSTCENECSDCCPMGLAVADEVKQLGHIKNPECIKCYRCVGACPHGTLASSMKKNEFHKEGEPIYHKSSLSSSIIYLQTALAVVLVTLFGFQIGGNIALSLGFLIGIFLARILHDNSISSFEISVIVLLSVAIYFRIDMNDTTSLIKGLVLLGAFILAGRLFSYYSGFEFIKEKAHGYKFPALVTLLIAGFAIFLGVREIHASMMVHKARAAIARQDYKSYITAMLSCADFVPSPEGAYFDLANAQLLMKDTDGALKNYKKSLDLSFKAEAAEVMLSNLSEAGKKEAWLDLLNDIISKKPSLTEFKLIKANFYIDNGELKKAEQLLEQLQENVSDNPEVYIALGELYIERFMDDKAENVFKKAYQLSKSKGSVALASFYHWNEEFIKAEEYFIEALRYFPKDPVLRLERGVNFALQNDLESAIKSWQKALELDPELKAAEANLENALMQIQATQPERPGPFKHNLPVYD